MFGNSRIIEILNCSETTATKYIKRMYEELQVTLPIEGAGKGKYEFYRGELIMCEYCSTLKLVNYFETPKDYENTINYIKLLIKERGFILLEGSCEIGCHKNEQGYWIDDIIYHVIKCPKCGQNYSCTVNTYRGGGSFKKGR